jgi:hypothetical protein
MIRLTPCQRSHHRCLRRSSSLYYRPSGGDGQPDPHSRLGYLLRVALRDGMLFRTVGTQEWPTDHPIVSPNTVVWHVLATCFLPG